MSKSRHHSKKIIKSILSAPTTSVEIKPISRVDDVIIVEEDQAPSRLHKVDKYRSTFNQLKNKKFLPNAGHRGLVA